MSHTNRQTGREIDDPGEQNQRTQIQYLNEIRQRIGRIRSEGEFRFSRADYLQAYRAVVLEYADVLSPYLRDEQLQPDDQTWGDDDADTPLWNGFQTSYTVSPPSLRGRDIDARNIEQEPEPVEIPVQGIEGLLAIGKQHPVTFEWVIWDAVRGSQTITRTANGAPPESFLRQIVQLLDEFRYQAGLGLKLQEEEYHGKT